MTRRHPAGSRQAESPVHELRELRDRTRVFADRTEAGRTLARMLAPFHAREDALVLGIPAGGIPVAVEVALALSLPMYVTPVSKILYPWTTESGFGALAFDGSCWLNDAAIRRARLDEAAVRAATELAREKVTRRLARFPDVRRLPALDSRTVILVDDGIAAGSTARAAAIAIAPAHEIILAVPTGQESSLRAVSPLVDAVYCANVRTPGAFAVADAYTNWADVDDDRLAQYLSRVPPPP